MSFAEAGRPDRLQRVGAAVAVLLLLVAALLAGIVVWEMWRGRSADQVDPVAEPQAVVVMPPVSQQPVPQQPQADVPVAPETATDSEVASAPAVAPPAAQPETPDPAPADPPAKIAAVGAVALRPAPDPSVMEESALGPLPRISPDGLEPWQAYARPFDPADLRPRVAVVLSGLGLSNAATEAAIQGLPGAVTLAFQPYSDNLQRWIGLARAAGHETMLTLPMEPVDYPQSDPGPQALFTSLSTGENVQRLEWVLSRVTGYVGVMNHMGSRFMTSETAVDPIMEQLRHRGLLFVDDGIAGGSVGRELATSHGVPHATGDRFVDIDEISRVSIDRQLAEVERIALELGAGVAVAQPYPVTLERLRVWLQTLEEKGIALAPVSAVVNLQVDR